MFCLSLRLAPTPNTPTYEPPVWDWPSFDVPRRVGKLMCCLRFAALGNCACSGRFETRVLLGALESCGVSSCQRRMAAARDRIPSERNLTLEMLRTIDSRQLRARQRGRRLRTGFARRLALHVHPGVVGKPAPQGLHGARPTIGVGALQCPPWRTRPPRQGHRNICDRGFARGVLQTEVRTDLLRCPQ